MSDSRVLRSFAPADVALVEQVADTVTARRGRPPLGEITWRSIRGHDALAPSGVLVPAGDGRAAAYAHLAHHHPREWAIEVAATDDKGTAWRTAVDGAVGLVAEAGGGHLTLWLHEPWPDDEAMAAAAGFTVERELHELRIRLPLDELATWPPGVDVRPFQPGRDEDEWVRVNNRAFAGHPEQGNWTVEMLRGREGEPWFDARGFLLAFDADGLAGFHWTKIHPAEPPNQPVPHGEVYVIGVDPDRQGTGLGRALLVGGLLLLGERGITTAGLYVDAANSTALALYDALGFRPHGRDVAYGRQVP